MTKPREKNREELQAEIEDGKKKIRQLENREKVLRQMLSCFVFGIQLDSHVIAFLIGKGDLMRGLSDTY